MSEPTGRRKPGRPKVYDGPYETPISVRFLPAEKAEVTEAIEASELNQNAWLRHAAMEQAKREKRARLRAAKESAAAS
jgi:hypothetical protein